MVIQQDLNTSHVAVNQYNEFYQAQAIGNLNTSHVAVNLSKLNAPASAPLI